MRTIIAVSLMLALAACMTPRAERYLTSCIEAGYSEGDCKMWAQEIDAAAWSGLGAGLQGAGAAMRHAQPPAHTVTNCQLIAGTMRCITF